MAETSKTTYLVNQQSNRNLALNTRVAEVYVDTLEEAKTSAERATRTTGRAHFVHEIQITTRAAFKAGPAVEVEL